jgi:hypothetical protein
MVPSLPKHIVSTLVLLTAGSLQLSVQVFAAAAEEEEVRIARESVVQKRSFLPVESTGISIDIGKEVAALPAKTGKTWKDACKSLARAFHEGNALWESGSSIYTRCSLAGKESASLGARFEPAMPLSVSVRLDGDLIKFSIAVTTRAKTKGTDFGSISIPITEWSAQFLADDEFASLLANALLDNLPVLGRLDRSRLTNGGSTLLLAEFKGQRFSVRKFDAVNPVPKLTFYKLSIDPANGRFFAEHLGEAQYGKTEKIKFQSGAGGTKRTTFINTARYTLDAKAREGTSGSARIWFHNSEGAGKRSKELAMAVEKAHERLTSAARSGLLSNLFTKGYDSISDLLFQTAASGYVGLRYGKQLLRGDKLVENGSIYGLLVEVRSGPLTGIKFYYDKYPKQEVTASDVTTNLEWTRFVLGRSFSFKLPRFINRIEVTPKLGRYYLSSRQPIETAEDGSITATQDFTIRNQPSVSLEFSAERADRIYTARAWYAIDQGIPFLPVIGTSAVSSERAGLDLFLNSSLDFKVFGVDYVFNILAFGMYENLEIEDLKLDDLGPGDVAVSGVELRAAYAGLGLVLNW